MNQKLLVPEYNATKIYSNIIQKYLDFHYHRECYDCCKQILAKDNIFSYTESHMNLLFAYYISSFYYNFWLIIILPISYLILQQIHHYLLHY